VRRILAAVVAVAGLAISGAILVKAPPTTPPSAALIVPAAYAAGQDAATPAPPLDVPAAQITDAQREARRFGRYDKDRNGTVSREEYLVNRRKAFAKADVNGDGRLDLEEYAATTARKFTRADRNGDAILNPRELAATALKRKPKAACVCPQATSDAE